MNKFFDDLINLTPVQHLVGYWWVWLLYSIFLIGSSVMIDRKGAGKHE